MHASARRGRSKAETPPSPVFRQPRNEANQACRVVADASARRRSGTVEGIRGSEPAAQGTALMDAHGSGTGGACRCQPHFRSSTATGGGSHANLRDPGPQWTQHMPALGAGHPASVLKGHLYVVMPPQYGCAKARRTLARIFPLIPPHAKAHTLPRGGPPGWVCYASGSSRPTERRLSDGTTGPPRAAVVPRREHSS